jgi:hypothetical protein
LSGNGGGATESNFKSTANSSNFLNLVSQSSFLKHHLCSIGLLEFLIFNLIL